MHVLTGKYLKEAVARFPAAAKSIASWRSIAKDKRWRNPDEVRETFADVEFAEDSVVFRMRQSKYRLVTTIHYSRDPKGNLAEGHVWVRSFLTQKQYEKLSAGAKESIR